MRSGEREAAGNARSSAIPPQGHVWPVVYSRRRAPASVDWWHEIVLDVRKSAAAPPSASKPATNRTSKATTKKTRRR
jgi:hypothetical protein